MGWTWTSGFFFLQSEILAVGMGFGGVFAVFFSSSAPSGVRVRVIFMLHIHLSYSLVYLGAWRKTV
ncbi:hypothetical protein HOY82DRAFT_136103 [Tuber indicum]|nr:hypothetical protein HOY82DRAFT_136103 [Tuber indicum]